MRSKLVGSLIIDSDIIYAPNMAIGVESTEVVTYNNITGQLQHSASGTSLKSLKDELPIVIDGKTLLAEINQLKPIVFTYKADILPKIEKLKNETEEDFIKRELNIVHTWEKTKHIGYYYDDLIETKYWSEFTRHDLLTGSKTIMYKELAIAAIECIKELKKEIEIIKQKIK